MILNKLCIEQLRKAQELANQQRVELASPSTSLENPQPYHYQYTTSPCYNTMTAYDSYNYIHPQYNPQQSNYSQYNTQQSNYSQYNTQRNLYPNNDANQLYMQNFNHYNTNQQNNEHY